jgi:hypothetical protein
VNEWFLRSQNEEKSVFNDKKMNFWDFLFKKLITVLL